MIALTNAQARRFILSKQGLLGKYRFVGKTGALEYVRQAGCIQFDPVDVCGKNAELTLFSRVRGFKKRMLGELLYKDRALVDYTDKELSIWPREDWPYFYSYRQLSRQHAQQFAGLKELEDEAIAYIRQHGAVSSDSLPIQGRIFWHSSMHWSGNWQKDSAAARSALEQLYTDGVLLIHHKNGTRKFYDLADRYFPPELLNAEDPFKDEAAFFAWRVKRRIGAAGMLWNRRSDAWLGIPMNTSQRDAAFETLEKGGQILPVSVEGIASVMYILSGDLPLLRAVTDGQADERARLEFMAPLDPMLWDRNLIRALWNYSYSWEIYTPPQKRKYGYYTLPVLCGQSFIGRIEAVVKRGEGLLEVKNLWLEPGVRGTKRLEAALGKTVKRLAAFNDCVCEPGEFRL